MAKLVLRNLVFATVLLFATLIAALSFQSTAANAAVCPTQSATLSVGGTLTTSDLIAFCNDNGDGLFLSAARAFRA